MHLCVLEVGVNTCMHVSLTIGNMVSAYKLGRSLLYTDDKKIAYSHHAVARVALITQWPDQHISNGRLKSTGGPTLHLDNQNALMTHFKNSMC